MSTQNSFWKHAVTASLATGVVFLSSLGLSAQTFGGSLLGPTVEGAVEAPETDEDLDPITRLLGELRKPEQPGWQQIETAIIAEWSKSGSAAMDLLLKRGQDALNEGAFDAAIEHLTALTDHAPEFAEGWNARATAFFRADMLGPALEDIERVLAIEPRHFGALTGLAIILEQVGYPEDAYAAWQAVEAIHPHRPAVKEALERLGRDVSGRSL